MRHRNPQATFSVVDHFDRQVLSPLMPFSIRQRHCGQCSAASGLPSTMTIAKTPVARIATRGDTLHERRFLTTHRISSFMNLTPRDPGCRPQGRKQRRARDCTRRDRRRSSTRSTKTAKSRSNPPDVSGSRPPRSAIAGAMATAAAAPLGRPPTARSTTFSARTMHVEVRLPEPHGAEPRPCAAPGRCGTARWPGPRWHDQATMSGTSSR